MKKSENESSLVSIVVITYNSSKYVLETLESAKAQTYRNIELIVSDDASTDDTVEICEKWIDENDRRFKRTKLVTSKINTGTSANCNRGAKTAKGVWLKLIAGDDILKKNCLTDNVAFANRENADLVFSDLIWFGTKISEIENFDNMGEQRKLFGSLDTKMQLRYFCRQPLFINIPSIFYKRKLLEDINYYNDEFTILEDQSFILKWLINGYSIKYLKKVTVMYRRHNETVQTTRIPSFLNDMLKAFRKYRWPHLNVFNIKDMIFTIDFYMYIAAAYLIYRKIKYPGKIINIFRPVRLFNIKAG